MNIKRLAELKKQIGYAIKNYPDDELPKEFLFKENVTAPKYKITVEVIDEDFIIDDLGRKWIKAKEDEE
jgi:hypothetical protein